MRPLSLLLLLGLTGAAWGDLAISGETKVVPYKLVRLEAKGAPAGAAVLWDVYPEDVADVLELPGGRLVLTAPPGRYRVKCRTVSVKDGAVSVETARAVVEVTGEAPEPPPGPVPVPVGPLTLALQAAYDALPAGEAGTRAADLARLRSQHLTAVVTCQDARLKTFGQLTAVIHGAVQAQIGDRLKGLRDVLAAEKRKVLPLQADAPLDAAGRSKAAELHRSFALALGEVK